MKFTMPPSFTSVQEALVSLFGGDIRIVRSDRVAGGDINQAYRLALNSDQCVFMKKNKKKNLPFFTSEAAGLAALKKTGAIGVPEVLGLGTEDEGMGCSFLLLEYIDAGTPILDYWGTLGRELADMHRAETKDFVTGGHYGFDGDNFIGAGAQANRSYDCWVDFFRDCRLNPQFRRADHYFDSGFRKKITALLDHLSDFLIEPEFPSLLHGDLWSGNVIRGGDGKAWIIDPATYVGHAEADLAMTELFGGFRGDFYHAYREALPLQPGYEERRDLYNLYHLLNHLNLFGRSYLASVHRIVQQYTMGY